MLQDRVGIGLGLYLPSGVVNRVNVPYPEVPRAALSTPAPKSYRCWSESVCDCRGVCA
ncbi:MAG: hypothetical protein U0787_07200 [Polyangia bacterium]